MSEQKTLKPWYKKWWGILLVFLFFPILVPYIVWTKTKWNVWVKVAVTAIGIFVVVFGIADSNAKKQEGLVLVEQAESLIRENKVDEALNVVNKSQEIYISEEFNPAFELEKKIGDFQSQDFMKQALVNISDDEFELLKEGNLEKSFIGHDELNKLFIVKLQENVDQRAAFVAEAEEQKRVQQAEAEKKQKEEEAAARAEMLEKQFSAWDGSHVNLTRMIKDAMNDPSSYEHVETRYWDMEDHLIVNTTFRGTNAFGAMIKNTVKAKVSLDGENIEIIEQL